jgi:hypothetical protein
MKDCAMQLVVSVDAVVRCVYSELIDLHQFGNLSIRRGSHVEPDVQGRWFADLSPVDGPNLGPFSHRSEALAAEAFWLQRNWLHRTDD